MNGFGFNDYQEVVERLPEDTEGDTPYTKFGMFDQLTINDYTPGQGIPPHVDTHSPF